MNTNEPDGECLEMAQDIVTEHLGAHEETVDRLKRENASLKNQLDRAYRRTSEGDGYKKGVEAAARLMRDAIELIKTGRDVRDGY